VRTVKPEHSGEEEGEEMETVGGAEVERKEGA